MVKMDEFWRWAVWLLYHSYHQDCSNFIGNPIRFDLTSPAAARPNSHSCAAITVPFSGWATCDAILLGRELAMTMCNEACVHSVQGMDDRRSMRGRQKINVGTIQNQAMDDRKSIHGR
jgi:hypothetical protein